MNKLELIKNITNDTSVHFHSFEQHNDILVAKSHFFNLHFGPERVDIVFDYTTPGPKLQSYSVERLPIYLDYNQELFYDILVETIDDLYRKFLGLEFKDEIGE